MSYEQKYLKYKSKYLSLKIQSGGGKYGIDKIMCKDNNMCNEQGEIKDLPPNQFIAFEKDNPGLFDEDKKEYYMDKKSSKGYRKILIEPLKLLVTDKLGTKSEKMVRLDLMQKNHGFLIVTDVNP